MSKYTGADNKGYQWPKIRQLDTKKNNKRNGLKYIKCIKARMIFFKNYLLVTLGGYHDITSLF